MNVDANDPLMVIEHASMEAALRAICAAEAEGLSYQMFRGLIRTHDVTRPVWTLEYYDGDSVEIRGDLPRSPWTA